MIIRCLYMKYEILLSDIYEVFPSRNPLSAPALSLDRVRSFWKDKNLARLEIRHTVKYHNLKNEFVITRSEHKEEPIIVDTLDEAKRIMVEVEGLRIANLKTLEKNSRYQVSVKAELSKITLPFYLHHVFRFFLFLWDFETDWYTTDFIY